MSKSENLIQQEILMAISKEGHKVFRSNAGKIKTEAGYYISLFPKGFPDLCGWRKDDGKFFAIEVKTPKGRLRKEQKKFAEFAEKEPIIYGVARSAEQAVDILKGG